MRNRTALVGLGLCMTLWIASGCSIFSTAPSEPVEPAERLSGEYVLSLNTDGEAAQSTLLWIQIEPVQIAGAPAQYRITGDIGYQASSPPGSLAYSTWYPVPGYVIDPAASEIEIDEGTAAQQASELPFKIIAHLERGEHGSEPAPASTLCFQGAFDLDQRRATGEIVIGADCDQDDTVNTLAKNYNSSRSNNRNIWNPGGGQNGPAPIPGSRRVSFQDTVVTAQGDASLHALDDAVIATGIGMGKNDRPALQDDGPFIRPNGDNDTDQLGRVRVRFPWIAPIPDARLQFETLGVVGAGEERALGSVTLRQSAETSRPVTSICVEFDEVETSRVHLEVLATGEVQAEAALPNGCDVAKTTAGNGGYNSSISNVSAEIAPDGSDGADGIEIELTFPDTTQITLNNGTKATGTRLRLTTVEAGASVTGLTGVRIGGYRLGTIPITSISSTPIRTRK